MLINGRCGLEVNWAMRLVVEISFGETPGKLVEKNSGRRVSGSWDSSSKVDCGAKSVQVNEWSREGMAMNIKRVPGQMCRWLGDRAKVSSEVADANSGGMWNSHHCVSMYSCW